MIIFRHFFLLTCCLCCTSGEAEAEDCETTVTMSNANYNSIVYVPPSGTVCFDCSGISTIFGFGVEFFISENINKSSYTVTEERNDSAILVVTESGKAFSMSSAETVKCCEVMEGKCVGTIPVNIFLISILQYNTFSEPEISGETTVAEGDTLDLVCDGSNSDPQPTLQWLSPAREKISDSGQLVIINTNRTMTGLYTCVATLPNSTMSLNTTVNVNIVYCEVVQSTELIIVNMTSTAMGSIATYQCRDGPTDDVYTTQCTSAGVWDPNPLSDICGGKVRAVILVVVWVIVAVVLVTVGIAACVIAVLCLWNKKHTKTRTELKLEDNRAREHTITFANHSFCDEIDEPMDTTFQAQNELYSTPRSVAVVEEVKGQTTLTGESGKEQRDTTGDYNGQDWAGGEIHVVQEDAADKSTVKNVVYSEVKKIRKPKSSKAVSEKNKRESQIEIELRELDQPPVPKKKQRPAMEEQEVLGTFNGSAKSVAATGPSVVSPQVKLSSEFEKEPHHVSSLQPPLPLKKKQTTMEEQEAFLIPATSVPVTKTKVNIEVQPSPEVEKDQSSQPPLPLKRKKIAMDDDGIFGTFPSSKGPSQKGPPVPQTVTVKETRKYAQVGIVPSSAPQTTPTEKSEKVEYASLDHNVEARRAAVDSSVCLDQILIQLREVSPHWRRLGEAVGLATLDEINEYVGGSESEAMVEVVDGWLAKLHPDKPTWREIADVVDTIDHHDLANSLRQAYISGNLPILVSNSVAETMIFRKGPPPAIPARTPIV